MTGINRKAVFLSVDGGRIDFVSDEGELMASVAIPPGRVDAAPYLDLNICGCTPQVLGVAVVNPPSAYGRQAPYPVESGANPDFQPTPVSALEGETRLMLRKLQMQSKRLDARMAAMQSVEHIPTREADPVIEPVEAVEPAPAPVPEKPKAVKAKAEAPVVE
ncbi:hypothetical protein [Pseudogemmobacter humi]|uniref:Uncharacterized protein n=1 Tax=Pseudogemmobacter humi TaxID=2483812 RepID=A0A3P5XM66_9RHOB|nr:hypothetical protein [Pseudogemmobacter humi]VDC31844.1 hypothetical protein XINFAN_03190 [Pseudogemmobacter humi]